MLTISRLRDLRVWQLGIDKKKAAEICHTTPGNYQRWERSDRFPSYVPDLLKAHTGRIIHDGFEGWYFRDGKIHTPCGHYSYSAGDIRAWLFKEHLLWDLWTESRQAKKSKAVRQGDVRSCQIIQFSDYK